MTIDLRVNRRGVVCGSASAAGLGLAGGLGGSIKPARAQAAGGKIHIVEGASTVQLTMVELITRQGYLKEFGVNADISHVSDGTRLMASLISGDVDVCMISGIGQIFPAVERGAKMKIIAGANTVVAMAVYSSKPDIKTLKDLEGRTVGVGSPGSLLHEVMVAALTKAGVDYTKVLFVNIGSNTDVFRAVAGGTVDAGPSTTDHYYQQAQFGVHSIGEMWKLIPEYPYQGSYATDEAIAAKRDGLVRILAAYGKLYRFMMSPSSKQPWIDAYLAVAGKGRQQAEDLWRFNIESQSYDVNLTVPDDKLEYLQTLNIQLGAQKKRVPVSELRDMSLANEALKMLGGRVTKAS